MAAELSTEWLSCLPPTWSYALTRDGRLFFISEETESTTWLHPVVGEPVITGHRKTADLPSGWEEGFTFEGARCFIDHHERKVTCKHPVSGEPSQENCIFIVNEQALANPPVSERKERPLSTMSEASNYTGGSDYTTHTGSPASRPSRPSKKVHNFGKRSNSIKRNPNAPVVRRNWLYKQDSTGMKLWKKRWFVLSDMCLFYYRDEKEESILGSILLPSFHISMLSVDDHINKKYAFKATHPNMRTYYFCTDTAKDMEAWMKVMTEAALVQTEPAKRLEKREANNVLNQQRTLTRPEAQKNARNREEQKAKDAERYGFRKDGVERPLTKISSIKLQPAQAAAIAAAVASSRRSLRVPQVNGEAPPTVPNQASRVLQRTNSMQQLEQWVRTHRGRGLDEQEGRSITSYQTLPRNMPSHHRAPTAPLYPEGYRTLPRNSVCSISPLYDRTLGPEKRRSMRDDTMWQLYEWQQRQAYGRQGAPYGTLPSPRTMVNLSEQAPPSIPTSPSHNSLCPTFSPHRSYTPGSEVSSPVFRGDATLERRHRPHLNKYAYPPDRRTPVSTSVPAQSTTAQSLQGKTPEELTLLLIKLRRQQAELNSVREHTLAQLMQLNLDAANPKNEILSHHLQRSLMYLDNQMKESEPLILAIHTMIENSAPRPQLYQQVSPDDYRDNTYAYGQEDLDVDAKLSRLCEQDKVVRMQEEKLQQLHREKHTLETALLSASQEIEMSADDPAAVQSVVQQRDVLQSGLLSTCRELARVTAELERSWREYDRLEGDVSLAKTNLLEQLEALGSPQTEPPSQQHVQIQKDLWRIQDVTEALSKNKPKRSTESTGFLGSKQISNKYKNEEEDLTPPRPPLPQTYDMSDRGPAASRHQTHRPGQRNGTHAGPDYRLYKSEPELTTVAEVDETNGEDKSEPAVEKEPSNAKAVSYPVGIVPPRTKSPLPESSTIASYVTLRKSKKPEPRMPDRPHSAVDQPCGTEAGRPRMSLEEQLERIRRNQEALLKDRKKSQESSPSRSSSFSKENPFLTLQPRKREDVLRIDTQDMHFSMENNEDINVEENISTHGESLQADEAAVPDQSEPLEPEETASPHEEDDKQKKVDRIITVANTNSPQNVNSSEVSSPEVDVESSLLDQEQMINTSYETSKLVSVKSLPSPPRSPPPTLPDGSHFMCV